MKFFKTSSLVVLIVLSVLTAQSVFAAGNISTSSKYSQFLNIDLDNNAVNDFINWNPTNGGATVSNTQITGYIWGETVGWINLGPFTNAGPTAGVKNTCSGDLSGYAWGENAGWINFAPTNATGANEPKINTSTGAITGTVWSENYGWIQLASPDGTYPGLTTSWKGCGTGGGGGSTGGSVIPPTVTVCNNGLDDDGDGFIDYPADPGCINSFDPNEDNPGVTPPVVTPPTTTPPTTEPPTTPNVPDVPTDTTQPPTSVPPTSNPPSSPVSDQPSGTTTTSIISPIVMSSIVEVIKPVAIATAGLGLLSTIPGFATRVTNLVLSIPFYRKRRPWGVVYDAESKQTIDPAYVVVYNADTNEMIDTKITDINGRYGFLLPVGNYRMVAQKTHYQFPSQKLAGRQSDEVYGDLYFGETFSVTNDNKDTIVTLNMPMDRLETDWNQEEKKRMGLFDFFVRNTKIWQSISLALFIIGFVFSLFAIVTSLNLWNIIVFVLYIVCMILHIVGFGPVSTGIITDKAGKPVSSAIVRVWSAHLGTQIAQRVTNDKGQYYLLVTNGDYYVTVDVKNASGGYDRLFTSKTMSIKKGIINNSFQI